MRLSIALIIALTGANGGLTAVGDEPTSREVAAAGTAFQKTCRHCHSVPDLRFETDRMWLDQVKRTA